MNLDWNDVHHFVALVEKQTLSAAAEHLDVQHSTVARRILRLEEALGLRLFDRVGKRYLLTQHGERVYQQAAELARGVKVLRHIARTQAQGLNEVTVSAPPFLLREVISPEIPAFYQQHAHVRLQVTSDVQLSDLHARDADIALRIVYPRHDDLVVARLRDIHYAFYAHTGYLARHPGKDWSVLHFLAPGNRQSQWSAEVIEGLPILLATNDFSIIRQHILMQQGVGLLPDFAVRPADPLRRVSPRADMPEALVEQLYLVMHESIRTTRSVRTVADFLTKILSR